MSFLATLVGAALLPQLEVQPVPAVVGEVVLVRAGEVGKPLAGITIEVELPGGGVQSCGQTAIDGSLRFTPTLVGRHVIVATIDAVRNFAPVSVLPAQQRWWLAFGTVPLALAVCWGCFSPARDRRGPSRS